MLDPLKGASGFLHTLSVLTEPECVGSAAHARLPGGSRILCAWRRIAQMWRPLPCCSASPTST